MRLFAVPTPSPGHWPTPLPPRFLTLLLALVLSLSLAPPVAAHDVWIELPAVPTGAAQPVELRVGDDPPGESLARNPRRVLRFEAVTADRVLPVPGRPGGRPAGQLPAGLKPSDAVLYVGTPAYSELAAEPFEAYLREEGLEPVIRARAEAGESGAPGRESYSRSLKALRTGSADFGQVYGLPLELVPLNNPFTGGEPLRLRALWQGEPLAGLLLEARRRDGAGPVQPQRTDAQGHATFALEPGAWMVAGVHMQRAAQGIRGDWHSVWTTLSFDRLAATQP